MEMVWVGRCRDKDRMSINGIVCSYLRSSVGKVVDPFTPLDKALRPKIYTKHVIYLIMIYQQLFFMQFMYTI